MDRSTIRLMGSASDRTACRAGPTTDQIPIDRPAGRVRRPGDIVVMRSCWEQQRSPRTPEFWTDAPYMTREASEWLLERGPRAVAFDFPQDFVIRLLLKGERRPLADNVTHDVLLRNGVTLIEYLSNTAALAGSRTFLCCLPLKIPGADGAPARVIALEE